MDAASDSTQHQDARKLIEESLMFNREKIIIMGTDPSSPSFVAWFMISSYFPVFAACLGPIANMIAVAGIVDKWGMHQGHFVPDPPGVFAVNVISLVIGCSSNLVLLLHFAKKVSYVRAQLFNIIGWSIAAGMLLIAVIVDSYRDMRHGHTRTIGFWYACITVALYALCTILLCVHFLGFHKGHYPATFNLTDSERNVMIFTCVFSLWFIWGSAMFSQLLNVTFGNALYFCTISVLTVGLGDLVPTTVAGKIMILIFSLTGVIILGLIIGMTRGVIQSSSGPVLFFYTVETARVKAQERLLANIGNTKNRDSFDEINKIRKVSKFKQQKWTLLSTFFVFLTFWLVGALVFFFAEGWSYFNCIYFCFLCLITIGYGDFAPRTGCGRAFFVTWAIGAVPLMTAIISTFADNLYAMAVNLEISIIKLSEWVTIPAFSCYDWCVRHFSKWNRYSASKSTSTSSETSSDPMDSCQRSVDEELGSSRDATFPLSSSANRTDYRSNSIRMKTTDDNHSRSQSLPAEESKLVEELGALLGSVKWLQQLSRNDARTKITFEQWMRLYDVIQEEGYAVSDDPSFWLSEKSPLRYPLDEPRYIMYRLLTSIENDIQDIITRLKDQKPHDDSASE